MYNIKQITNYDLTSFDTVRRNSKIYAVIPESYFGTEICKLGYCKTKPSGIGTSFYFTMNDKETEIVIGKTGMYEINVDEYYNREEDRMSTIKPRITELKLPKDVEFILDYAVEV